MDFRFEMVKFQNIEDGIRRRKSGPFSKHPSHLGTKPVVIGSLRVTTPKNLGHNAEMTDFAPLDSRALEGANLDNPGCKPGAMSHQTGLVPECLPSLRQGDNHQTSDILISAKICHW